MTEENKTTDRPVIGVALSGGSGRAIAHIGVLEVMREYKIPIDIITACSSGAVVAASYACSTLEELKQDWLSWDKKFIINLLQLSEADTGIFAADKITKQLQRYFKGHKNLEEVTPRLGFVCVDINTGLPLTLSLGDMAKAGRASCAVPGLFEPVEWGNKLLVDGGLVSLIPIQQAKELGADIVIGVDIAATRHMYKRTYIQAWRGYRFVRNRAIFRFFQKISSLFEKIYKGSMKIIFYNQSDFLDAEHLQDKKDLFFILSKALDISSEEHVKGKVPTCDIMLSPEVKHLGKMDFESSKKIYLEGRRVGLEAVSTIQDLIKNYKKTDND